MILFYIFFAVIILALACLSFMVFDVIAPALFSSADSCAQNCDLLFSDKEKFYVMGKDVPLNQSEKKALVLCSSKKQIAEDRIYALRGQTCAVINEAYGSLNDCAFSCIGLGDCVRVCPQEAIEIENNCAIVIRQMCIGCGECVSACPQKIIKMVLPTEENAVLCTATKRCMTSCSDFSKVSKIKTKAKTNLKFWQKVVGCFTNE